MATKKRGGVRGRKTARLVGVAKELADARRRAEKADPRRRRWSYARIANAAGVAPETVYRALTGKTKHPAEHIEARFRAAIAAMNEAALAQVAA